MTGTKPSSMRKLDNAIKRMAGNEKAYVNVRSLIANAIVGWMIPDGVVKGGTSLKLRFGDAITRYTTDLDTARAKNLEEFSDGLDEALAQGWQGFTGRVVPREPAHPDGVPTSYVMQPFDVKLSYLSKAWCTVSLEVGHDEIGDADEPEFVVPIEANSYLEKLGFPAIGPIACMPLYYQIAQKLHGASEPGSKRPHDLIDLQVIVAVGDVDWGRTRQACERLFAYRKQQQWPPTIKVGADWETLYGEQRSDLNVAENVVEAVDWANRLIARIAEYV